MSNTASNMHEWCCTLNESLQQPWCLQFYCRKRIWLRQKIWAQCLHWFINTCIQHAVWFANCKDHKQCTHNWMAMLETSIMRVHKCWSLPRFVRGIYYSSLKWTSNPLQCIEGHSGLSNYVAHIIYEVTIVFYVGVEDGSPKFWWSWGFNDGQVQAWPNEMMHGLKSLEFL